MKGKKINGVTRIKKKDKKSNRTNETVSNGEKRQKDIVTVDDDAVSERTWVFIRQKT